MKKIMKKAFIDTIPVLTGYLVLGFGFGIVLKANGYGILMAFVMSLMIYAGSMQYVAIGLLTSGASLITVALTTLMVNARHLFYGISMIDKYKNTGKRKPYLIFALADETYSLVCNDTSDVPAENRKDYYLLVSLFNQIYWIDFALTALFLTVFIEQWLSTKKHAPAMIGVGVSVICLLIFGSEKFLIPTMLIISLLLCLYKEEKNND